MPADATIGLAAYSALLNWVTTDRVGIAWLHDEWELVLTEYRQLRTLVRQAQDNFAVFAIEDLEVTAGRRTYGRRHPFFLRDLWRIDADIEILLREREVIARELDTIDDFVHVPLNWTHRQTLRAWYRWHETLPEPFVTAHAPGQLHQ